MEYKDLPPNSRVWVYQANRLLTSEESEAIQKDGNTFVDNWTAHGSLLKADLRVFHNLFLVLFADEAVTMASGCSIDSSVRWIKDKQKEYSLDFMGRMNVAYRTHENVVALKNVQEIEALYENGEITDSTLIFNNLVQTKQAFEESWEVPFVKSWVHQRISV